MAWQLQKVLMILDGANIVRRHISYQGISQYSITVQTVQCYSKIHHDFLQLLKRSTWYRIMLSRGPCNIGIW